MLKRAYVEITNICNLRCSFCPGTRREKRYMSPTTFRLLAEKLRPYVRYLYLHVMGEPLLHPQLSELLDIARALDFKVCLTTNGTLLAERRDLLLSKPPYKVSVSLHAMEGNGAGDLLPYLTSVWNYVEPAASGGTICALRLWNIGGADQRNGEILGIPVGKAGRMASGPAPAPRRELALKGAPLSGAGKIRLAGPERPGGTHPLLSGSAGPGGGPGGRHRGPLLSGPRGGYPPGGPAAPGPGGHSVGPPGQGTLRRVFPGETQRGAVPQVRLRPPVRMMLFPFLWEKAGFGRWGLRPRQD